MDAVLDGLRVAEVSAFVAAPLCGMTLAQMGADVIQISPVSGRMDEDRWPQTKTGKSLYWAGLNKGKRSIRLDLSRPEGRELCAALMAGRPGDGGGVVLTNLPLKGPMASEALRKRRPDLILMRLLGNPDGSPAIDYTVNSAGGLPFITGDGETPYNHAVPVWDVVAGLYLVNGLLAAERRRLRTGKGQTITLSLADAMLATLGNLGFLAEAELNATPRPPAGNQIYGAFGRDFPLKDGRRVMVAAITDKQFKVLCKTTGTREQMAALKRETGAEIDDEVGRYHARDAISEVLGPWFADRTLQEVEAAFSGSGVIWGPFQTFQQLLKEDPRCSLQNPLFARLDQPGIGKHLAPHGPIAFEAMPRQELAPAPALGEHSEAILADVLGLSPGEIGKLFDAGLVAGVKED